MDVILFNLTELKNLIEQEIPKSVVEMRIEQNDEDFNINLVYSLSKDGRRVTSKHRIFDINWLTVEKVIYQELMEAWNNNEDVLVPASGRSSSIIIH